MGIFAVLTVLAGGVSLVMELEVQEENWCFAPLPPAAGWPLCLNCAFDSTCTCMRVSPVCVLAHPGFGGKPAALHLVLS